LLQAWATESAVALSASKGTSFQTNHRHATREVENSKGLRLALPGDLSGQPAGLVQRAGPVHRFDFAPLAFEHNLVTHLARELSNGARHNPERSKRHRQPGNHVEIE
jgi:hypothetical protein